ncbi:protein FAM8A1 [Orussus abietinus]|uniref:protein FAM8A1 n=1 Tax=Orussus abietinus TaxID=222816 RepID=UPI000626E30F|nr:protein FAM8A1 [Orussus abietinus]XP_012275528.1 protein FAM8A1 [Orussus abietinus]XP_012275529.1 protein FAM8A1 [Orussus abietinus]
MSDKENLDVQEVSGNDNGNRLNTDVCSMEERSEYFKQLEKWLQEVYTWQSVVAMFPYYVMSSQIFTPNDVTSSSTQLPTNIGFTIPNVQQNNSNVIHRHVNEPLRETRPQESTGLFQPPGAEGFEYRIPPVWKRFAAEFIDSGILFIVKLSISFIAVNMFDFAGTKPYNFDLIQANLQIDYKMALEVTSELFLLELMYKIFVCIFEAFWLQHGSNGQIGGATPGKTIMGLRVVRCGSITLIERPDDANLVLVSPGTDLGLPLAVARSVIKNLILAFLFPICFVHFFFRFKRTAYDLVCKSIVVEDPYRNNNRLNR